MPNTPRSPGRPSSSLAPCKKRKLCQEPSCEKSARGATDFCVEHGGGKRCQEPGCEKSARDATDFCVGHGGGKRCQEPGCEKLARGATDFCKGHGGGKRCQEPGCEKSAQGNTDFCKGHGGGKRCQQPGCEKSAAGATDFCIGHGGGKRCQQPGCGKSAQGATDFCIEHGGGKRCQEPGCEKSARDATDFCIEHGGGKRCEIAAAHLETVPPPAYYKAADKWHCWGCFAALHPDLAKLKVRKEHYIIAEIDTRLHDVFATAVAVSWDCPVAGGCTLLRPDLLVRFAGLYLQVEIDEHGHQQKGCAEEDSRLSLIAADVGLPGVVLRINPDQPGFECFRKKALSNGEVALECTKHFKPLMDKAEDSIRKALATPPSSVIQLFVDADPDAVVQTSRPW
jgi:hypothetical protein